MISDDTQLMSAQARMQVIQAMLAHARHTLTPQSFQAQSKGWLREWDRLEADIRRYLSSMPDAVPRPEHSVAAGA